MTEYTGFSITGKRVLITGGTAGIGLGVAEIFVAQGAQVVITGRRESGRDIASGIGAVFVQMDVSVSESLSAGMLDAARLLGGRIDVLILNAGIDLEAGMAADLDMEQLRRIYDVNVFGVVQSLRDGLVHMQPGGSVIITSSPAGSKPVPGMSGYGSSKAAVNYLTKCFAAELADRGIRVNAILPGLVESEMAGSSGSLEFIRTLTLTGKVRKPAEIAPSFQFLASDASAPVTAAIIEADDGLSAGLSMAAAGAIASTLERNAEFGEGPTP
jgi:NAD(P)-dependent dehydrogenase (short-subunit alcohol dehydrogenase family)